MKYRDLYLHLISGLLTGSISRERAATRIAAEVPIEKTYSEDAELLENCEWGLRHANEPDYYTTTRELEYYLRCLRGEETFSSDERDKRIQGNVASYGKIKKNI